MMSRAKQAERVEEPALVHVPPGSFLMGTSDQQVDWLAARCDVAKTWKEKGRFGREQPQHAVPVTSFFIGRFAVTVGAYRLFLRARGYQSSRYWTKAGWAWRAAVGRVQPDFWDDEKWAGDDALPVVGTSWYEAAAYCQWLSDATGKRYRLPTEAQWEKAARGPDGRLYPWGDAFEPGRCSTRQSGMERTVPAGSYGAGGESPYGCMEMAGNASEWTLSEYRPYPYDEKDGRNDGEGAALRVTRGGSWYKPEIRARVAARGVNDPFFADNDVGFRCVLED